MSAEYDKYLNEHRANVKKGYEWFKTHLPELLDGDYDRQIGIGHDTSKNQKDEYDAYDAYFYGHRKTPQVCSEFNVAWLKHIHRNPHHWQHWILINDDPENGNLAIEIPTNYVVEMICDWWAFSWQKKDLNEIFKWYDQHKDYIEFHPKTRKLVEDILDKIKTKLEEESA